MSKIVYSYNPENHKWKEYQISRTLFRDKSSEVDLLEPKSTTTTATATNNEQNNRVVVKLTSRTMEGKDADEESCELRLLKKLKHKSIVKLLGGDMTKDLLLVYMEYVNGESLYNKVVSKGHLMMEEMFPIYYQLLEVLVYLQSMSVAHLDLKPEHIMIDESNKIKLIDFDAASEFDNYKKEQKTRFVGSLPYMSPEMYDTKGQCNYSKCDIFTVQVIFATCLMGEFCWSKPSLTEDEQYRSWNNQLSPSIPFVNSTQIDYRTFCFLKDTIIHDPSKRPDPLTVIKKEYVKDNKNHYESLDKAKKLKTVDEF